ncbi:MAG: hypothetical protein K2O42_06655 [Oscillospiraceae bacterium]|nr:hypothetical protein [Oscillospiraceae bacterium]
MIVLQIVLKIIVYLLLFLLILCGIVCLSSVVVKISFWDKKFTWRVCYLGFQILPFRKKKKSRKKEKIRKNQKKLKKNKNSGNSENPENSEKSENLENPEHSEILKNPESAENFKNSENPEKKTVFKMDQKLKFLQKFVSRMDMAGSACAAVPGTLRIFASALQWCDIQTDIIIGGEDAYESARNYGILQAIIQNLLAQTGIWMKVRRKDIRIACDFTQDESSYHLKCAFRLHIGLTILAVLYFIVAYFRDKFRMKSAIVNPKI